MNTTTSRSRTSETLVTIGQSHVNTHTDPPLDTTGPSISDVVEIPEIKTAPSVEAQVSDAFGNIEYPGKVILVVLTIALMFSILMIGLDTNIIGVSRLEDSFYRIFFAGILLL